MNTKTLKVSKDSLKEYLLDKYYWPYVIGDYLGDVSEFLISEARELLATHICKVSRKA